MQTVTPYLLYEDAAAALEFLQRAFGFQEIRRMEAPDGRVSHAEMRIGDGEVHLGQPDEPISPRRLGGTPVLLYVVVEDVDAHFAQAKGAGAGASTSRPTSTTATAATPPRTPRATSGTSRSRRPGDNRSRLDRRPQRAASGRQVVDRASDAGDAAGIWMNLGVDVARQMTPPSLQPAIGLRPGQPEHPAAAYLPLLYAALSASAARSP